LRLAVCGWQFAVGRLPFYDRSAGLQACRSSAVGVKARAQDYDAFVTTPVTLIFQFHRNVPSGGAADSSKCEHDETHGAVRGSSAVRGGMPAGSGGGTGA
jgi:hypothetical protein